MFAVYHPEHGSAIAQGGRYDNIGEKFGNPRPATGFDMDLKILLSGQEVVQLPVFAPFIDAKNEPQKAQALYAAIHTLRAEGGAVQVALSASEKPAAGQQQLVEQQNSWEISN